MKKYAVVLALGVCVYFVINCVAVGYNVMGDEDDVWRIQHYL